MSVIKLNNFPINWTRNIGTHKITRECSLAVIIKLTISTILILIFRRCYFQSTERNTKAFINLNRDKIRMFYLAWINIFFEFLLWRALALFHFIFYASSGDDSFKKIILRIWKRFQKNTEIKVKTNSESLRKIIHFFISFDIFCWSNI